MKLSVISLLFCSSMLIFACQHDHKQAHDEGGHGHHHHEEEGTLKMDKDMKPVLIHTVFFWTKEGTTAEQKKAFEAGLAKLGTCPQIQSYFWGPPAPTENRDVVDNTYDYAINVHFASVNDQNEYQDEPIHQEFITNHQDLWEKVVVYDNVVK